MRASVILPAFAIAWLEVASARAQEETPDRPTTTRTHAEERPFAYALDPTTPSRGDASIEYGVGVASSVRAERPLPAGLGYDGALHSVTIGYGITSRFAPFLTALGF